MAGRKRRSVGMAWGMATARWRLLPELIVVGGEQVGVTALCRLLEEHPQLMRSNATEETGFFEDEFHHGMRWYASHFPLCWPAQSPNGGRARAFEGNSYYLFHPLAAERIARHLPGAQVVVLLRDPAERAYSAHRQERSLGREDVDFEEAIQLEAERLAGEEERLLALPGSTSFSHRHHAYLGRSHYAHQVGRFRDALGADRVHLVEAERFFAEPQKEFRRLQEELGLDAWDCGEVATRSALPAVGVDPDLRERLRTEFAADDEELSLWLGHAPIWHEEV
jgi:Sulfotransferase domain